MAKVAGKNRFAISAAWTGALAAFVLEKILEIALLFLRFFLRARSRSHSVLTPEMANLFLPAA
jgi:hypothetical protein